MYEATVLLLHRAADECGQRPQATRTDGVRAQRSGDVGKGVLLTINTLDVLLLKERLDRLWHTMRKVRSNEREGMHTFLMSGILGAKRCEI